MPPLDCLCGIFLNNVPIRALVLQCLGPVKCCSLSGTFAKAWMLKVWSPEWCYQKLVVVFRVGALREVWAGDPFLVSMSWEVLLTHSCPGVLFTTVPNHQDQLIVEWHLRICEPTQTFPFSSCLLQGSVTVTESWLSQMEFFLPHTITKCG